MASKPVAIIAGIGNGGGTGAAVAREFALNEGYCVAVVARKAEYLNALVQEIKANGGDAIALPIEECTYATMASVFRDVKRHWPAGRLKFACWNTKDIQTSVNINIVAAFAFAQEATRQFVADKTGGTLIVTGATSATRGAARFGAFAAGKHGLRALTHSLAREYGSQGVHAVFVIVDGTIRTPKTKLMFSKREGKETDWLDDSSQALRPESIAKTYVWLHKQDRSAWTMELDLRPAKEHF